MIFKGRLYQLSLFLIIALNAQDGVPVFPKGEYHPMPLKHPMTSMELSQDGRLLFIAHRPQNLVSIWDTTKEKVIKELKCYDPAHILFRRSEAYIANGKDAKILVFSEKDSWNLVNEIVIGKKGLMYLSAADDSHFSGKIFASCYVPPYGRPKGAVVEVDIKKDTVTDRQKSHVGEGKVATVDCSGDYIFYTDLKSLDYRLIPIQDFRKRVHKFDRTHKVPILKQYTKDGFWFNGKEIFGGRPLTPIVRTMGAVFVPDVNKKRFYELKKTDVTARNLDVALTPIGSWSANLPPSLLIGDPYHYNVNQPVAATHGDTVYIYVFDKSNQLYSCKLGTKAIETGADEVTVEKNEFFKLPLSNLVNGMALMEDHKHLLMSHSAGNRVTVLNTETLKPVKEVKLKNPGYIICRGTKAYILNDAPEVAKSSCIAVLSSKDDWKLIEQVPVNHSSPYYLSAAQGESFDGKIMAVCEKNRDRVFSLIDMKTKKVMSLTEDGWRQSLSWHNKLATLDYSGMHIILQNDFCNTPGGSVTSFNYAEFMRNTNIQGKSYSENTPTIKQYCPGAYWTGFTKVYAGIPPRPASDDLGAIFPTPGKPMVFALRSQKITSLRLEDKLPKSFEWSVKCPDSMVLLPGAEEPSAQNKGNNQHGSTRRQSRGEWMKSPPFFHNLASTTASGHSLFYYDQPNLILFACRIESLDVATSRVSVITEIPNILMVGDRLEYRLFGKEKAGKYALLTGPKSMAVTSNGILKWTPSSKDVGKVRLKIRASVGDDTSFHRYAFEVVPRVSMADGGGETGTEEKNHLFRIYDESFSINPDNRLGTVLLVCDSHLRVLDEGGRKVLQRIKLTKPYKKMLSRRNHYIGLHANGVDIIEKKGFRIRKSLKLNQCRDIALHPNNPDCYVTLKNPDTTSKLDEFIVCKIDERTGKFSYLKDVYGTKISIDATGRYIVTSINRFFRSGGIYNPHLGRYLSDFESWDALIVYEIYSDYVILKSANSNPGADGSDLDISFDGKTIAYTPRSGIIRPKEEYVGFKAGLYDTGNPNRILAAYDIGEYPEKSAFHPILPWIACLSSKKIVIYDVKTGKELPGTVSVPADLKKFREVVFSPNGRRLIVVATDSKKRTALYSLTINLTGLQSASVDKGYQAVAFHNPKKAPPQASKSGHFMTKKKVSRKAISAITSPLKKKLSTKDIANSYLNSVVVINHRLGSGTGFFVSEDGYVLTCAHVIPELGDFYVTYPTGEKETGTRKRLRAELVAIDRPRDLALLKIMPENKVKPVCLPSKSTIQTGQSVCLIGHPGLGNKILDYTMTAGIVSNRRRLIESMPYIQTNAAINPGMSGGPMFDEFGNVIGVVVLKAKIESVGMAVPHKDIMDFVGKVSK